MKPTNMKETITTHNIRDKNLLLPVSYPAKAERHATFHAKPCRCCQKSVYLPCRHPSRGSQNLTHGQRLYMKKAFTKRFVLTLRNFATFRYSQEQGNSRCPTWYVFTSYHIFTPFRREACWCKHILRGVSALLVLLYRAMRRPRSVDGRTVRTPTLLFVYNNQSNLFVLLGD